MALVMPRTHLIDMHVHHDDDACFFIDAESISCTALILHQVSLPAIRIPQLAIPRIQQPYHHGLRRPRTQQRL